MNKKPYIRILPDIDVLFVDGDSCCASAYGDKIGNMQRVRSALFS